mmetsp:Transcript_31506/g.61491  ORF Transcript_31506/g.61491 Transcript_31506/m.61491 type:complete len:295 (-) Transcript_31506:680-1564(-)
MQIAVVVHLVQGIQHTHVRRHGVRIRRHHARDRRHVLRKLLGDYAAKHVFGRKDTHELVSLHDQHSLPARGHHRAGLSHIDGRLHSHCGLASFRQNLAQRRNSAPAEHLLHQRAEHALKSSNLRPTGSSSASSHCTADGCVVEPVPFARLLCSFLEFVDDIEQTLGDVQHAHDSAFVHHRKVPEVAVDHQGKSLHRAVFGRDATRVGCHHLLHCRGRRALESSNDSTGDVVVRQNPGQRSIARQDRRVLPLRRQSLCNVQDRRRILHCDGLVRSELRHRAVFLGGLLLFRNLRA